ncbi:hypothetical protein PGT21_016408 [Puccinia graminis f. sp. tritici]|uniref:Uncharacterized protein n=1 Tax=Puccinia graminis f. sp. tritici TaxID=56615 RepID=A0A5B0QNE6_PUCGR|nr:hypothetical protein PGT21_016408 [Puccinia graminis f. sp. tritici]
MLDVLDYRQDPPPETQESTLGPSQQTPYEGIFFEETLPDRPEPQSQLPDLPEPDELTETIPPVVRQAPVKKSKKAAATRGSDCDGSLLISLDYCFYINNHNPLIPKKHCAASNGKTNWGKITPSKDVMPHLKTNLLDRRWDELQDEICQPLGN